MLSIAYTMSLCIRINIIYTGGLRYASNRRNLVILIGVLATHDVVSLLLESYINFLVLVAFVSGLISIFCLFSSKP